MNNITFQTPNLFLRPCQPADAPYLFALYNNPQLMQYFYQCRPLESHEAQAFLDSFVKHHQKYGWGPGILCLGNEPIGLGAMTYYDHNANTQKGDLFYIIQQAHWSKGYATDFTKAAINFAFQHTDITRIVATAMPENKGSMRVLEKSGFTFEKYVPANNRNHYQIHKNNSNAPNSLPNAPLV